MFLGQYRHGVDNKGRVAIPAPFRRDMPAGTVISIGPEGRLVIRPPHEWAALVERFRMTADTQTRTRAYIRSLYASAREVEADGQGRMLLDASHRTFAHIEDRAVFIGVGNVVEVVGAPVWDREQEEMTPEEFTQLGDHLENFEALS